MFIGHQGLMYEAKKVSTIKIADGLYLCKFRWLYGIKIAILPEHMALYGLK